MTLADFLTMAAVIVAACLVYNFVKAYTKKKQDKSIHEGAGMGQKGLCLFVNFSTFMTFCKFQQWYEGNEKKKGKERKTS